jgi:hypothetical protein
MWLKQSTAYTFRLGPFVDSTDGFTPETALTIAATDVFLSKAGAAFAAKNEATALTGTGDARGYYTCVMNTTDTNTLGALRAHCYVAGALPVWQDFMVVPANVYESLVSGTEFLETTGLRADFAIVGTTLTVKKTDGSTTQYTKTISSNASAEPIVGLD